jgi:DUF917 family protein
MTSQETIILDAAAAEAAVLGGAVLGGGGGGSMADGLAAATLAVELGDVALLPVDAVDGAATLLTVSAVGAPAAKERYMRPVYFVRAVEQFRQRFAVALDGLITNECGGNATVNGWLQAAALGIPLVDAPCNGRAHPTGVMGSMGLHRDRGYLSRQTAVGGSPHTGRYLEAAISGSLEAAAALVREASVKAGGLVAVARNPVTAAYAKANAAPGAVRQSIGLGRAILDARARRGSQAAAAAADYLGGSLPVAGQVTRVSLETRGGFDVGTVALAGRHGEAILTFWNEYMTLETAGERLGTFPDLIATLDAASGRPLSTAEIAAGQDIVVLLVPRANLLLGAGMRDPALFAVAEAAVGKDLIRYSFPERRPAGVAGQPT